MSLTVPFVVGQWVRGERFYGRREELAALAAPARGELDPRERVAPPRCTWIAGLRRVGKTSLLRELELALAAAGDLPIFWDLQGTDDPAELAFALADALLEAEPHLARHGVELPASAHEEPAAAIAQLRRATARAGVRLVLLCDEADSLLALAGREPACVAAIGEALLAPSARTAAARVVLTCAVGAAERIAPPAAAGPLVTGVREPRLLGVLAADEAASLLRQDRLPREARPRFSVAEVELLRRECGDHPMLLQLAGRRSLEGGVAAACALLGGETTVHHLFGVDLALLTADERELLAAVAAGAESARTSAPNAQRLVALGLLACDGAGTLRVRGTWLARWLRSGSVASS